MRPKRPLVSPEDQALFLEAVGGATPLSGRDRVNIGAPKSVIKVVELPPEVALAVEGDGRSYAARAPGVSLQQVAQLRAGKLRAEHTLDLHGETIDKALGKLRAFLVEQQRLGRRTVLVIHGKGTHSEVGAPLREAVLAALLGQLSGMVHALATAAPSDGGEGATYVMLRGPK
jgi:DNA-nicking Smr family endonuclease